ncbi:MAG: GNAT family N-acetyltransferase [Clostridia bacterium]|nr:GNAT family N-acetyltransferase [Clostridia bacterium]
MKNTIIRKALKTDVPYINDILNYAIINTNYNLNEKPRSLEKAYEWFDEHKNEDYPVLTAEVDGKIVGWASLSHFRAYSGYDTTAEISVYVSHNYRHKGIGTLLVTELERAAKRFHMLIAVITDNNSASLSLHSRCGFAPMCTFRELARKNNEYVDITFMTKIINKK